VKISSPVDNITSTDGATLLSSTTAPRFTDDELETIADNVPNRSSRNLFDIESTAVFPYLLEPDKTIGFPFSVKANKHYSKTAMYHPGQFSPEHKPEENWPEFIKEVWSHLEHYSADGISPEQYKVMLKPHFSQQVWGHIFEDYVSSKPDPESKAEACRTVLYIYTLECYKFEVRIRDYNKFMAADNLPEFCQSFRTYEARFATLRSKTRYKYYLELLNITRHWTPNERSQFFNIQRCFNIFRSPNYEKITTDIVTEAITHSTTIFEERLQNKRQLANITNAQRPNKKHRKNSNN
jgi:hypothetical protein